MMLALEPSQAADVGLQLADIHLPPAAHWWPLAPGWWLLGAIMVAALIAVAYLGWRWRRRVRLWHAVRDELDKLAARHAQPSDRPALAAGLSQLLRRAVIRAGGDARAQGAHWYAQLQRLAPGALDAELIADLERATYQRTPTFDAEAALVGCRRWLRRALLADA